MELYLPKHNDLGRHQFAIIDKHISNELTEEYPTLDIVSENLKPQSHLYPALLPLHELSSPQWKLLIEEIQQNTEKSNPRISLLLESQLSAETIRKELANILIINDDNNRNFILRYYDPRVLFQLSWMLTPWQLQIVLKTHVIPSWTYLLEKNWYTLYFPEKINHQNDDPIDLPVEQISRIGLINQTLSKLPIITPLHKRIMTSKFIDKLLLKANSCGLTEKNDVVTFAQQGIKFQCAFWLNPEIIKILNVAKNNTKHYHRMTSNWNESYWENIAANSPNINSLEGI